MNTKMNTYKFLLSTCLVMISLISFSASQDVGSKDYLAFKKFDWNAQTKTVSGSLAIHFSKLDETFIMNFERISLSDSNLYLWYKRDDKIIMGKYKNFPISLSNLFGWTDAINKRHDAENLDVTPILAIGEISLIKQDGRLCFMYSFYRAENYRFQWNYVDNLSENNSTDTNYELWHGVFSKNDFNSNRFSKFPKNSIENIIVDYTDVSSWRDFVAPGIGNPLTLE